MRIFDAYRRVALSASKKIGPRVIGLLTAKILLDDRDASDEEEQMFEAAETLNDRDFDSFKAWMEHVRSDDGYASVLAEWIDTDATPRPFAMMVRGLSAPSSAFDPAAGTALTLHGAFGLGSLLPDAKPLNLYREVGHFAVKLKNVGLLEESSQEQGDARSQKWTNHYVLVSRACEAFYQLSLRANVI